ncbi:hypothetical protein [Marinobacterium sedimentorum]|uniref:hypothetical protein n=1 Tax=Marinobacterium sedimentorum TaxID=2927804 RepID=UPI0020C5D926|nr:hypothetical protein [Marinobacterium sedimentorum]MCP8688225.1 hypothetical protein [Marinobacterium sedimentorum]
MISKLRRGIESGAFMLALLAGTVNAVGLLGFAHQSISHLRILPPCWGRSWQLHPAPVCTWQRCC